MREREQKYLRQFNRPISIIILPVVKSFSSLIDKGLSMKCSWLIFVDLLLLYRHSLSVTPETIICHSVCLSLCLSVCLSCY